MFVNLEPEYTQIHRPGSVVIVPVAGLKRGERLRTTSFARDILESREALEVGDCGMQ